MIEHVELRVSVEPSDVVKYMEAVKNILSELDGTRFIGGNVPNRDIPERAKSTIRNNLTTIFNLVRIS